MFSLKNDERGGTDLASMDIDTGNASPKKQPPRRMPIAVCQEVAKQLKTMQQKGVMHLEHLQKVIDCLQEVHLKLNPMKCRRKLNTSVT